MYSSIQRRRSSTEEPAVQPLQESSSSRLPVQETPAPVEPAQEEAQTALEMPEIQRAQPYQFSILPAGAPPPPNDGPVTIQPSLPDLRYGAMLPLQRQPDLAAQIQSQLGKGMPLGSEVQHKLERGLGDSLSGVRVHTDHTADALARSVQAVAFTTGSDIFFRQGAYSPESPQGLHLLAHEATHTIQQKRGPVAGTPHPGGVSISDPSDRFERAADAAARTAVQTVQRSAAASLPAQRTAAGGENDTVALQRFSEADLKKKKKIDWSETTQAKRSGEGVSGGVYFMRSAGGNLVVKPDRGNPGKGEFADKFLGQVMGLGAPENARVVLKNGKDAKEFQAITNAILGHLVKNNAPVNDQATLDALRDDLEDFDYYKVMATVAGSSLSSSAKGLANQQGTANFGRAVMNQAFLFDIGKMVVGDAAMGAEDRLSLDWQGVLTSNLGNIMMLADGKISLIDSSSRLNRVIEKNLHLPQVWKNVFTAHLDYLRSCFDKPDEIVDGLFQAIKSDIPANEQAEFNQWFQRDKAIYEVKQGIKAGINRVVAGMPKELKKEADKTYGKWTKAEAAADKKKKKKEGGAIYQSGVNWDVLMISQFYLHLRLKGLDHDQALAECEEAAVHYKARSEAKTSGIKKLDKAFRQGSGQRIGVLGF